MKTIITTRFISNADLWHEISAQLKKAKRVCAAIAYVTDGTKLLSLKKGDRLVVDMSLDTVRQRGTNPREVKKLMDKKVQVFSRASLHAKLIIADKTLIAGSANVSKNSQDNLDEAGIITTEPAALRRASDFFERLCTEPVREQYLKECIKAYDKAPRFFGKKTAGKKKRNRIVQAKLWFIGGLRIIEPPKGDSKSISEIEKRAQKKIQHPDKSETSWIRYGRRPKFFDHIRVGDWVVQCLSDGSSRHVDAPAQVLDEDSYTSNSGKKYTMLMLEAPINGEPMSLADFRRRVRSFEPVLDKKSPRTRPIKNNEHADVILSLWTSTGRLSQHSKSRMSRARQQVV